MLDLEHLEALDDDAMPEPDLGQAHARARRMRARRRWTAAAAAVVVLGGAAVTVAALRSNDHAVQVLGPSGATSVPPAQEEHPTASGTLPNGLPIVLTLETPTVALGDDIRATVVVRNDTDRIKTLGVDPISCALGVGPVLSDAAGNVVVNDLYGACPSIAVNLFPGESRSIDVKVATTSVPPSASASRYSLALKTPGEFAMQRKPVASVPVRIVPPDGLAARLAIPQTGYPSGYSMEGTIVFVNGTGGPIEYHLDCSGKQPWDVLLSKDGVLFESQPAVPGCAQQKGATARLRPGENRLPFYVGLGYPSCGRPADGPASPECTGDPPGIPDLPPGAYQLVFRGDSAPFDSIDVQPLDIQVTARGKSEPPVSLPKIGAENASEAQHEFEALYFGAQTPFGAALVDRGVEVNALYTSGNRLILKVLPSGRFAEVRSTLLSLFDHPEMVTVQEAVIMPQ